MKSTYTFASVSALALVILALAARPAHSGSQGVAVVRLQSASAGATQVGHLNISGTGLFGKVGINTLIPSSKLHVLGDATVEWGFTGPAIFGSNNAASGFTVGVMGAANGVSGTGTYGIALSPNGFTYGVYGNAAASGDGTGVKGVASAGMGVYGLSNRIGVQGETTGAGWGVIGTVPGPFGVGVSGYCVASSGAGVGVEGFVQSPDGIGIHGGNFAGGASVGILGEGNGTGVKGVAYNLGLTNYGVFGRSESPAGVGVYGETSAASGVNIGVKGVSASTNGFGVYGLTSADSGPGTAIYGESKSMNGAGMVGVASSTTGGGYGTVGYSYGPAGIALYGLASDFSSVNIGLYAATYSGTGYAGYFQGRTHVNGNLSKLGGSFKIDHPLDPANKYLVHSFVESPDMLNVYSGTVRTDDKGEAWAELPSYFEAENGTFRYQLTAVEDENSEGFCMLKVGRKIKGNTFLIRSNVPNIEVCWQVTGIRQDPWAEANRIVPEPNKADSDRGRYLTPELYGQPREMGITYRAPLSPPAAIRK